MNEQTICITMVGPADELGGRDRIEELLDEVMEHLLVCDIVDPNVGATYDGNQTTFEFEMIIADQRPEMAVALAMNSVRGAFHAVSVGTPGWEDLIDEMVSSITAKADDNRLVSA